MPNKVIYWASRDADLSSILGSKGTMSQETDRARLQWLRHQGKDILFIDFSHASVETSLDLIGEFFKALNGRAEKSVLLLTDVTGAGYDPAIAAKWKTARIARSSIIRSSAIYGLSGLVGMAIRGFMEALTLMGLLQESPLKVFKDAAEAKDWLVKQ